MHRDERHLEPAAQPLHKPHVAVALLTAKVEVAVHGRDADVAAGGERGQKRHAVGAAADAGDDTGDTAPRIISATRSGRKS